MAGFGREFSASLAGLAMIHLLLPAQSEANGRFVSRLFHSRSKCSDDADAFLISEVGQRQVYSSRFGLVDIEVPANANLDGDVVVVDPKRGFVERLIRARSSHNTLLITERCDQLCVMCSQPPKKSHSDRFAEYLSAIRLAPHGQTIGLSGGEPTLYKEDLFDLIAAVHESRPDLSFHVLTNGQHFEEADRPRLSEMTACQVTWGIPVYSAEASLHDLIVAKDGAFSRLMESFTHMILAGAKVELRTVLMRNNLAGLTALSNLIANRLSFCSQWSIMQLERTGYARNRFEELYVDPNDRFEEVAAALDTATLFGVSVALFNFPRCHVPYGYRDFAVDSISDWKQKFVSGCNICSEKAKCSGFFEWQPAESIKVFPL